MYYSVKDKNNRFSYNIWSGTDLNKSIQYSTEYTSGHQINVSSSDEYSNIGDYAIKLSSYENAWVRFKLQEISQYVGKTITLSAMVYSPLSNIDVSLVFFDSNNNILKNVSSTVNANTQFTAVSLNDTIIENTSYVTFMFSVGEDILVYIDKVEGMIS